MAKKKTGLKGTLKKNQTPDLALPKKKALPKVQKDISNMEQTVEELHKEEEIVVVEKKKPAKSQKVKEETPIKMKRLTIDLDKALHKKLKVQCYQSEVSMREYVIGLIQKDLQKY